MKSLLFPLVILVSLVMVNCNSNTPATSDETTVADSTKKMITARIFLKPEYVSAFIQEAIPMIDSSNAEPGCEGYMLYQNPYDSTQLIFVETWKDQAAIDNHFSMSYFKAFGPKTQDWLARPTELTIMSVVKTN